MNATFAKLRDGSWGLRVKGQVSSGQSVTVTKKSGGSEVKTVGRVLWSGDGVSLCTIAGGGSSGRDSAGNRIGNGDSYRAGVTAPGGRRCQYCGSRECEGAWGGLCDED